MPETPTAAPDSRAAGLREAAELAEAGRVSNPLDEAEHHVNDCFTDFAARLRRMADEEQPTEARPTSSPDEPRIVVTVDDVEAALRNYLAHLDYDLHKGIERNEETGEDTYDAEAADLFARLATAAEAQQ